MEPFVREYMSDAELKKDVQSLVEKGVDNDDIYILAHDDERTDRLVKASGANKVGLKEIDFTTALENIFNKKGDELRNKLQEVGITKEHSQSLERDMDDGKLLLIVANSDLEDDYLM